MYNYMQGFDILGPFFWTFRGSQGLCDDEYQDMELYADEVQDIELYADEYLDMELYADEDQDMELNADC